MQIEIHQETSKKINKLSKLLGLGKKEVIDKALLLYLDNLNQYKEFKKEMKAWDLLSEEAWSNLDRSI